MAGTGRIRRGAWLVALQMVALAAAVAGRARADTPAPRMQDAAWRLDETPAELLQSGCMLSNRLVIPVTNEPLVGATVTVVETGFTTQTDATGAVTIRVPGAGTW